MFIIRIAFFRGHGIISKFLARLSQPRSCGVRTYDSVLKVFHPLLQRSSSHLIELIHANQYIFREYLGRHTGNNGILFLRADAQPVFCMHTDKGVLTVIEVILPLPDIKIENADGIYLLHLVITFSQRDVFGNGFCHTIKDSFQIVKLTRILNLDDDDFPLAVLRLDINTIKFVISTLLVAFTFQDFLNGHFLIEKNG